MEGATVSDGSLKPAFSCFRSLDDCRKIASWAQGKHSAAVTEALLGLEAARGLQNFGLEVHVVHIGGHLMPQQLDPGRARSSRAAWKRWG